jgi:hypothetical protein
MRKAGAPGMRGYNVAEILAVRIFFETGNAAWTSPCGVIAIWLSFRQPTEAFAAQEFDSAGASCVLSRPGAAGLTPR